MLSCLVCPEEPPALVGSASPGRPLYLQTEGGYQRTEKEPFYPGNSVQFVIQSCIGGQVTPGLKHGAGNAVHSFKNHYNNYKQFPVLP